MLKRFLDAEDMHLQDNHFPDEIAAMRAEQEGSIVLALDQHADDYMMSSEEADQRAQQGYRSEHPEGQGVNT